MLHQSAISVIIEKQDAHKNPLPFSVSFVKLSTGDVVHADQVQCLSSHFKPRTYNFKFANGEIRKVRHISITHINGQEVYW